MTSWSTREATQLKLRELANISRAHAVSEILREAPWDAAAFSSAGKLESEQLEHEVLFVDMEMLVASCGMSQMLERPSSIYLRQIIDRVLERRAAAQDAGITVLMQTRRKRTIGNELPEEPEVLVSQPRASVLWKPPGWSVKVGRDDFVGLTSADAQAAEAERCTDQPDPGERDVGTWLMHKFGKTNPIALDTAVSRGLVHRLDKMTSGALLWASCYSGYYAARLQFAKRENLQKEYVCLCHGLLERMPHVINTALSQASKSSDSRRSVAASPVEGKASSTLVVESMHAMTPEDTFASLVRVQLLTGRQHQIRAHLSERGHALVGDVSYGGSYYDGCPRMFLHSIHLSLDIGDGDLVAEVQLPADLQNATTMLRPLDDLSRAAFRKTQSKKGVMRAGHVCTCAGSLQLEFGLCVC